MPRLDVDRSEETEEVEVHHGAHSEHLGAVSLIERELGGVLLVKVLKDVVGISDGLVAFGPHFGEACLEVLVVGVLVACEIVRVGGVATEVLTEDLRDAPNHIHAIESLVGH